MRRPKAFVLAFILVTFSWVPAQMLAGTGLHMWLAFITAVALFGGFALMVAAVSAGFKEQKTDATSLNL